MITTGFKLFFGYCMAAIAAAVVFGYTTGGNHLGPLSGGYKGSVGNHAGYVILLSAGLITGLLAFAIVSYRDGDATTQASLLGVDSVAPQPPLAESVWPIVGALGAVAVVIGLVLSPAVFIAGLILLAVVLFEWMIQAWADRLTGDAHANAEIRNRIMRPIEFPILGLASVGIVIIGMAQVFLAVSKAAAVWIAIGFASVIMLVGILFAMRPKISRNLAAGALLVLAVGVIAAGIISAAAGTREFHKHGEPAPRLGPPTTAAAGGGTAPTTTAHK